MSDLSGQLGEMHMVLQVKRKATGQTEEYRLVGKVMGEEPEQKEASNGGDSQHGSAERRD